MCPKPSPSLPTLQKPPKKNQEQTQAPLPVGPVLMWFCSLCGATRTFSDTSQSGGSLAHVICGKHICLPTFLILWYSGLGLPVSLGPVRESHLARSRPGIPLVHCMVPSALPGLTSRLPSSPPISSEKEREGLPCESPLSDHTKRTWRPRVSQEAPSCQPELA